MAYLLGNLPPLPFFLTASGNQNRTGLGRTESRNNVEQRALARTVDSDQRQELAFAGAKIDRVQHGAVAVREAHTLYFEEIQSEPPMPCTKSKSLCVAMGVRGPGTTSESAVPA